MRFFFDRNMSVYLARMIAALERNHVIRHHDDDPRFAFNTPDTEWISILGKDEERWIVLSGDGRILRNSAEHSALRDARLTFFCMSRQWMSMPLYEYAWKFVKVWPDILENAKLMSSYQCVFEVTGGRSLKIDLRDRWTLD
jgi:PIN like domain